MLLPASVFIGMGEEDCCGCCGYENYNKRCSVSLTGRALGDALQP